MSIMNKIKDHPGFLPFGHANVKSNTSDTQSTREKQISKKEIASDSAKSNK